MCGYVREISSTRPPQTLREKLVTVSWAHRTLGRQSSPLTKQVLLSSPVSTSEVLLVSNELELNMDNNHWDAARPWRLPMFIVFSVWWKVSVSPNCVATTPQVRSGRSILLQFRKATLPLVSFSFLKICFTLVIIFICCLALIICPISLKS